MDINHPDDGHTPLTERTAAKQKRRRYTLAQKREMVEATLQDGQSVSVIARRYDVNTKQLFGWRKQYFDGRLGAAHGVKLLPVEVSETPVASVAYTAETPTSVTADGTLEVLLANRHRLLITGRVCQQSLATILRVLS